MSLDIYWVAYDATLARIREERPVTFEQLKAILDTFQAPSSAQAFFPDGADDTLMSAVTDAGWVVSWAAAYYHYKARHPATGARFEYVEGDLYDQSPARPTTTKDPAPWVWPMNGERSPLPGEGILRDLYVYAPRPEYDA